MKVRVIRSSVATFVKPYKESFRYVGCLCNFNAKVIKDWGIIKKNHLFCCKLYASSYYKQMKGEFLTTAFKRIRARMRVANASDDDSEDALQDAFCRLWTRKEEIHGEKQAEGLLSVAARNIRIDKIRAARILRQVLRESISYFKRRMRSRQYPRPTGKSAYSWKKDYQGATETFSSAGIETDGTSMK